MTVIIRGAFPAKLNRYNLPSKRLSADSNWKLNLATTQECWQFDSSGFFADHTRCTRAATGSRLVY